MACWYIYVLQPCNLEKRVEFMGMTEGKFNLNGFDFDIHCRNHFAFSYVDDCDLVRDSRTELETICFIDR